MKKMATDQLTSAFHPIWDGEEEDEIMAEIHAGRRERSLRHGGDIDSMAQEIREWEARHLHARWALPPNQRRDRETALLLCSAAALGLAGLVLVNQD